MKTTHLNVASLANADNLIDEIQKILSLDTASSDLEVTDLNGNSFVLTGDQIKFFKLGLAIGVSTASRQKLIKNQPKPNQSIH